MSKYSFESLKSEFGRRAIYDLLKGSLWLALTVLISSGITQIVVSVVVALEPFRWYIGTALAIGGALGLLTLHRKLNRHQPSFSSLESDFQIVEMKLSYTYLDKNRMRYRKAKLLKALRNGLDKYPDKYRWTGSGKTVLTSGIPQQTIVETDRKNVWQTYEIRFERTLTKGETIPTEAVWELEDPAGTAVPFFSATILEPTDSLKLCLALNPALGVSLVTCDVSVGIGAGKPFKSSIKELNARGEVEWIIENPQLLHYYEMKWKLD